MSFAVVAVSALVAGVAIQAYGQYQAAKASEAEGESAQAMANYNAKLRERQADAERKRAIAEAQKFEKEGEVLQGRQKVQLAKGGVLMEGTPAIVLEETAKELEADRMSILREGLTLESIRLAEAEGERFAGRSAKARGKNLATAGKYRAAGTLLTGTGRAGATGHQLGVFS